VSIWQVSTAKRREICQRKRGVWRVIGYVQPELEENAVALAH
jgi:hypothetical protein